MTQRTETSLLGISSNRKRERVRSDLEVEQEPSWEKEEDHHEGSCDIQYHGKRCDSSMTLQQRQEIDLKREEPRLFWQQEEDRKIICFFSFLKTWSFPWMSSWDVSSSIFTQTNIRISERRKNDGRRWSKWPGMTRGCGHEGIRKRIKNQREEIVMNNWWHRSLDSWISGKRIPEITTPDTDKEMHHVHLTGRKR